MSTARVTVVTCQDLVECNSKQRDPHELRERKKELSHQDIGFDVIGSLGFEHGYDRDFKGGRAKTNWEDQPLWLDVFKFHSCSDPFGCFGNGNH